MISSITKVCYTDPQTAYRASTGTPFGEGRTPAQHQRTFHPSLVLDKHTNMIADEDDKFHDEEIIYFEPSPSNQINEQTDEPNQFMDDLLQSIDNLEAMKRTYMYLMDFHTVYISNTVYGLSNKAEWTRNVEDCTMHKKLRI